MQNNTQFEYTYVAPTEAERKKTQSIREHYQQTSGNAVADKVARLQALDKKAKLPPMIVAWALGVLGTLIFGGGLAMVLEMNQLLWGCILAAVGLIPVALAYPIYRAISKKQTEKYREEILRLSDEILKEE